MIKKIDSDFRKSARQIGELTLIPMYLVGGPLIGYWMGGWCDSKLGTDPYIRAGLMVLGLVSAFRECWRMVQEISQE